MSHSTLQPPTLGVIYGNRDFFPDQLVTEARADIAKLFGQLGIKAIQLGEADSKLGGVETHNDARKCAELFKKHADEIDGILVCLPNFGDEKGVADTLKLAGLNVPVLIQGYPDDPKQLMPSRRRDSFCGKISVCNNLVQAGIKFSLTSKHVSHPTSDSFKRDLQKFLGVCRVVNGLRGVRLGAVGARPGAFNTVRYSEKILERHGISVTTVDLSEIIGAANKLDAHGGAELRAGFHRGGGHWRHVLERWPRHDHGHGPRLSDHRRAEQRTGVAGGVPVLAAGHQGVGDPDRGGRGQNGRPEEWIMTRFTHSRPDVAPYGLTSVPWRQVDEESADDERGLQPVNPQ